MTDRPEGDAGDDPAARYWADRGGKPQPRPRHPLTDAEEHEYLVRGSELCNAWEFYDGHDEWEEVWRRADGDRRALLHGLIQVAVGYEHLKRGNPHGVQSLLRQGADKLEVFVERDGVGALRDRALRDAGRVEEDPELTLDDVDPPKLLLVLEGFEAAGPPEVIRIPVPRG